MAFKDLDPFAKCFRFLRLHIHSIPAMKVFHCHQIHLFQVSITAASRPQERQPAGRGEAEDRRGRERQGGAGRGRRGGLSPMDLLLDILG